MPNCSRGSPLSKHPLLQHVVLVCTAESARGSVGCKVHAYVLRPWVKSLSGLLTTHPSFGGPLVEVVLFWFTRISQLIKFLIFQVLFYRFFFWDSYIFFFFLFEMVEFSVSFFRSFAPWEFGWCKGLFFFFFWSSLSFSQLFNLCLGIFKELDCRFSSVSVIINLMFAKTNILLHAI